MNRRVSLVKHAAVGGHSLDGLRATCISTHLSYTFCAVGRGRLCGLKCCISCCAYLHAYKRRKCARVFVKGVFLAMLFPDDACFILLLICPVPGLSFACCGFFLSVVVCVMRFCKHAECRRSNHRACAQECSANCAGCSVQSDVIVWGGCIALRVVCRMRSFREWWGRRWWRCNVAMSVFGWMPASLVGCRRGRFVCVCVCLSFVCLGYYTNQ